MPSVQDVRDFLRNLSSAYVPDATVRKQIDMAEMIVVSEKGANATEDLLEQAILASASYLTYLTYATYIERGTGRVPEPMLKHLGELKALADRMLGYIKRGSITSVNAYALSKSIWEEKVI